MNAVVRPKCDMLIDQNRFIGGDPVGHCCHNDATKTDGEYFFCDECLRLLAEEPARVTIPPYGTAKTWERDAQHILDRLMTRMSNAGGDAHGNR